MLMDLFSDTAAIHIILSPEHPMIQVMYMYLFEMVELKLAAG